MWYIFNCWRISSSFQHPPNTVCCCSVGGLLVARLLIIWLCNWKKSPHGSPSLRKIQQDSDLNHADSATKEFVGQEISRSLIRRHTLSKDLTERRKSFEISRKWSWRRYDSGRSSPGQMPSVCWSLWVVSLKSHNNYDELYVTIPITFWPL